MFKLKDFQHRALQSLSEYFEACLQFEDSDQAYYFVTKHTFGQGIPFNQVQELPSMPYICFRLPTGGGKTFLAAHSIGTTANKFLQTEFPLVLWLTPSNIIRNQTLRDLCDLHHPYRIALEAQMGSISVLDISEASNIQPATLNIGTTIIVSTMQAFRVEDIEGRKVYEQSGALMGHFSNLPQEKIIGLEIFENGQPVTSLANVLCLHRPLVIIDEAHNARTSLSFATLARFNPSCILEFTATPDMEVSPSNVIHTTSAAELKAEGMIKLPIQLETHQDWKTTISESISCRNGLEVIARQEQSQTGEYIRPIVLIQAQPSYKEKDSITIDIVEEHLINEQNIPSNQIARATGTDKELDGVDLFDASCPIRYIITVQALREGWDCSFAYVLCSLAEMHGQTAVEQILGRILRLPKAKTKNHPELNKAYAFASSLRFVETANALGDALIQNGFERQEIKDLIVQSHPKQPDLGPLFTQYQETFTSQDNNIPLHVNDKFNIQDITDLLHSKIQFDPINRTFCVINNLNDSEVDTIGSFLRDPNDINKIKKQNLQTHPRGKEQNISIPLLVINQNGTFELFEDSHFLDRPWKLSACDPFLSKEEFPEIIENSHQAEIDINSKGQIITNFIREIHDQMAFLSAEQGWSVLELASWLDRNIPHRDIQYEETIVFINSLIERLIEDRRITLAKLVKEKYRLKQAVSNKIDFFRKNVHNTAYQYFLLPGCKTPLIVKPEICFSYDPDPMNYPCSPNSLYRGNHNFKKHYYPTIGDLRSDGEEFHCAQFIDNLEHVETWVRNLDSRPRHSFWLQTSTDKFYPDFVCKLYDGRYLVVEYKGEDRWSNDNSKEKRLIGKVWEEKSEGLCLFVMPNGNNLQEILAKI